MSEYAVPTSNSGPFGIAVAPDSSIWFTEANASKAAVLDPSSGTVTEVSTDTPYASGTQPDGVVVDQSGRGWVTIPNAPGAGLERLAVDSTGADEIAYVLSPGAVPEGVTVGPDGTIWYTELSDRIAMLRPNTGTAPPSELLLPTATSSAFGIVVRADGVWYTETDNNKIAHLIP
jgi:virginiamycin B lyase